MCVCVVPVKKKNYYNKHVFFHCYFVITNSFFFFHFWLLLSLDHLDLIMRESIALAVNSIPDTFFRSQLLCIRLAVFPVSTNIFDFGFQKRKHELAHEPHNSHTHFKSKFGKHSSYLKSKNIIFAWITNDQCAFVARPFIILCNVMKLQIGIS